MATLCRCIDLVSMRIASLTLWQTRFSRKSHHLSNIHQVKDKGKEIQSKKLTSDSVPDSNPSAAQTSTSVAYSGATSAVTVSHGNGNASQQRPDVVPGAETSGYDESSTSGLTSVSGLTGSSLNNPTSASGPAAKIGSRPKHKRQDQVQQLSYNHSRPKDE